MNRERAFLIACAVIGALVAVGLILLLSYAPNAR
jgi:hypothetical protein